MDYKSLIRDMKLLIKWKPNAALPTGIAIALNYSYRLHYDIGNGAE